MITKQNEQGKRLKGQFFTITNPFKNDVFANWFTSIPDHRNVSIIEPFAGGNNIVTMIAEAGFRNNWSCYDIDPSPHNVAPEFPIHKQDTLKDYPKGKVAITNPPYLAKNSATRRGLPFPNCPYDDLYKYSLEIMLSNTDYVAAIVPESFITSGLFHKRLHAVVSLACEMFNDTNCPVCLALFKPAIECDGNFVIYRASRSEKIRKVGSYQELLKQRPNGTECQKITFNDPNGILGIICIDDTRKDTIRFVRGETIPSECIKISSRSRTRVSGTFHEDGLDELIERANQILNKYRERTNDVFLTAFKGLRKDGKYRRRLDFGTANQIIDLSMRTARGEYDVV